jgi:hypothetical protein
VGVYIESGEAAGGAVWDSTPSDLGSQNDKTFDEVRFECDTDGAANVAVYTDLPGELFAAKGVYPITTGPTGRHWATVPLPPATEGRSIRLVVSSGSGFRIYRAQVRYSRIGRYICAATPAGNDAFNSLEFDFRSEREKPFQKIELDMRADGVVNASIITDQLGKLTSMYAPNLTTPNGRAVQIVRLPPGIRGRLFRVGLTSSSQARIYQVRVWTRQLNDGATNWGWEDYPLEESDQLPTWADLQVPETPAVFSWSDLPVEPTKPEWTWQSFPVNPTDAQWFHAKVLSIQDTPNEWNWVDIPMESAA